MDFWRKHPALLLAFFSLLGTACAIAWHPLYLLFFLLFSLSFILDIDNRKKPFRWQQLRSLVFFSAVSIGSLAFISALLRCASPSIPQDRLEGEGILHIENLKIVHSPFNRSYCYKGVLKSFQAESGAFFKDLPCSIFQPLKNPPSADKDYKISGFLIQKGSHDFCLKPHKGRKWQGIAGTFSFAAWRYSAKQRVASYIKRHVAKAETATFLTALITGETDERSLRIDFGRLGLQHLLAISGFHFSFFALALNLLLRLFCPFKPRIFLVIASLTLYFFFLGNAPSILRAFLAISFYLGAQLLKRRTNGINVLGTALVIELFIDPLVVTQLSFQLSFLCTLALLLYTPILNLLYTFLLSRRSPVELKEMPILDKHGYLFTTLVRKALSVTCAVHLLSLPLLLYLFHKFPLLSLLYNLFFPFCVTLSLSLFYLALLTAWLPPLSALIHNLNTSWTSCLLELTSNPPAYFDIVLRSPPFSYPLLLCTLLLLFFTALFAQYRIKKLNSFLFF